MVSVTALELQTICQKAGEILEQYRKRQQLKIDAKTDGSPVTDADRKSSELIIHELHKIVKRVPIISEESWDEEDEDLAGRSEYWIVDPLDGTKDFIAGKEDYTVNMCWIKKNQPHMGCIYHPPSKTFYFAQRNVGTFIQMNKGDLRKVSARLWPSDRPHILLSRSHATFEYDVARKIWPEAMVVGMASALKFGKLAEGYGDLYFREGPTMEWDTAAGQLIVEEAGGIVIDWQCEKLEYSKKGRKNPGFIALANRAFLSEVYDVLVKSKMQY